MKSGNFTRNEFLTGFFNKQHRFAQTEKNDTSQDLEEIDVAIEQSIEKAQRKTKNLNDSINEQASHDQ